MENCSDTKPKKKMNKTTTAAELFKQIQSRPGSSNFPTIDLKADQQESNAENDTNLDYSISKAFPKETQIAESSQFLYETAFRSSEATTPIIRNVEPDQRDLSQLLLSLHNKMDKNIKQMDSIKQSHVRYAALLSQMNAKLDAIATKIPIVHEKPVCYEPKTIPLTPIKCLDELDALEKQSKNEQFVKSVVEFLGSMHGKHRYVGEGNTVCLQIVNYFFEREFLMNCSWSGISRNKDNENIISKIPFHKFVGIIDLFHKVVLFSDPSFSKVQCEQFLHRCLRNARQRFEETKGIRASVARKRFKGKTCQPNQTIPETMKKEAEIMVEEYLIEELSSTPPSPN